MNYRILTALKEADFRPINYTDLAKADIRAHVSSHALTEFPPGVLEKNHGNINFIPTLCIIVDTLQKASSIT
jgi:hypothetical protein